MSDFPNQYHILREICENLKFGEMKLVIQNGLPVRIEQAVQSIKLGE